MLIVHKYGGSSVATLEQIKKIAEHIKLLKNKNQIVVVVSAMGKTTNKLIEMAKEICDNPSKREMDLLLSTGECVSASLMSMALNDVGVPAIAMTGYQAGIKTNDKFGRAFIDTVDNSNIIKQLDNGYVVVVTGFQGENENREITTLGRGGSDTTAVAIAASLGCPCEIYSDVEAVCSVDPTIFNNPKRLHEITYVDMMEMAINGAKVLETRCVELAEKYDVDLYLGKSLETDKKKGTYIMNKVAEFEKMIIKNISIKNEMIVFYVKSKQNDNDGLDRIFDYVSDSSLNLELVGMTKGLNDETVITFAVPNESAGELKKEFDKIGFEFCIKGPMSKIVLVGSGIASHPKIASGVFRELRHCGIAFENIAVSEVSIAFTTSKEHAQKAVEILAKKFDL